MSHDLLRNAQEQAENSDPPVKAAALLRIARVQMVFDREQAGRTLREGLDAIGRLTSPDSEELLEPARMLTAAVAPEMLREIPVSHGFRHHLMSESLGRIMLEHGHISEAVSYLIDYDEPSSFPFGMVSVMMPRINDQEVRLALLRRAIEAWRTSIDDRFMHRDHFIDMFQAHWKVLPSEEALQTTREIVRVTLEWPDTQIHATLDAERGVRMTSRREHSLFEILHVVRHIDPALAESLIASHEQLAAAARRFPNGIETVKEEAQSRRSANPTTSGGYVMVGPPEDIPCMRALIKASQDGDFELSFEHALQRYRKDVGPENPNSSVRECWPSTAALRSVLYHAGKRIGRDAAVYLERIPDPDLRLFAQIELAAAQAGLPELQGIRRG